MENEIRELTEGMQRLCAVANRIVAGKAGRIEADLLLEHLRRLYDVALRLEAAQSGARGEETVGAPHPMSKEEKVLSTMEPMEEMARMSTMAAMALEPENGPKSEDKSSDEADALQASHPEAFAPESPMEADALQVPQPEIPVPGPRVDIETPQTPQPEPQVSGDAEVADATPQPQPEPQAPPMPSVEELEGNDNALLFDEVVIENPAPAADLRGQASPQPSLLDYLGQTSQRTLGESLGSVAPPRQSLEKKVDDLRTVININDKFSFMSELFKGNMKAYNDFIMRLNATEGREEALAHVSDVAAQYKWDDASPAVKAFYKIFDKKF